MVTQEDLEIDDKKSFFRPLTKEQKRDFVNIHKSNAIENTFVLANKLRLSFEKKCRDDLMNAETPDIELYCGKCAKMFYANGKIKNDLIEWRRMPLLIYLGNHSYEESHIMPLIGDKVQIIREIVLDYQCEYCYSKFSSSFKKRELKEKMLNWLNEGNQ